MKHMGWSWQELMAAPFSVTQEIIAILNEMEEERERQELLRS